MNGMTKIYYSISEVCAKTGLEPHVLRYWESEFSQLRPKKNRAGNRAYRGRDIQLIETIKRLLYEEKFTIPGARKQLSDAKFTATDAELFPAPEAAQETENIENTQPISIAALRNELGEVLRMLRE